MQHLSQERQQLPVAAGQAEPWIIKGPVVCPLVVGHAVWVGGVLEGRPVPVVGARQLVAIVEPGTESRVSLSAPLQLVYCGARNCAPVLQVLRA